MAGVIGKRLRLTTSRKPSYRRAGVVIGNLNTPTYIERDDVTLDQALAIVRDPNIAIAFEDEEGAVSVLTDDEREAIAEGLETEIEVRRVEETVSTPAPDATDAGLLPGSGDLSADRTEPTAQPEPPAPEPAAPPKPASKGRGKAKGSPA